MYIQLAQISFSSKYYVKLFNLHKISTVAHTYYVNISYVHETIIVLKEIRARQIVVLKEIRAIHIMKYFHASEIHMDPFEKSC